MSKILIVDDEEKIREMTRKFLRSTEHMVDLAKDGVLALEMLERNQYDLVVVDLKMPRMDGANLIERIRRTDKYIALIVLTGHGDWDTAYEMLAEHQISQFLNKPLQSPNRFVFDVENALENSRLRRNMEELVNKKTAEIAESERKFRSLIEFIPIPVTLINQKGDINYVNQKFMECFGFTAEELINLEVWADLVTPAIEGQRQFVNDLSLRIAGAFESGSEIEPVEATLVDKSGQEKLVKLMMAPVEGVGLFVINDLTQMKQKELELQKANELAQSAVKAKSLFLAKMSHEIRTPINIVMGFLQLALEEPEISETVQKNIQVALKSSRNLRQIIDDILDLSKIDSGKYVLENISFNLSVSLDDMLAPHIIAAREKGLYFNFTMDAGLPSCYMGDPVKLNQVFDNLVGNAVKFTEKGGISIKVEPGGLQEQLQISIQDTGPGLESDDIERIFMPFEQADESISRKYKGTGLGTTISRQIVELMGGRIWIESEPLKGSNFIFTLNLKRKSCSMACFDCEELPISQVQKGKSFRVFNILLAEDNEDNINLAVLRLESKGHQVVVARNGQEAVRLFKAGDFDLILMDIMMPVMDGIEASKKIRAYESNTMERIPILALSAAIMADEQKMYIDAGMDKVIPKPLNYIELCELIQKITPGSRGKKVNYVSLDVDDSGAFVR